jgi:hypothetical protein
MNLKRLLLLPVIFLAAPHAYSQLSTPPMSTLKSHIAENEGWKSQPSEIAFLALRCGSLFSLVSGYIGNQNTSKGNALSEKYNSIGKTFDLVAYSASINVGMSPENIVGRARVFKDAYVNALKSNKLLHNNAFEGDLADDLSVCSNSFEFISKLQD